jgi:excisionase family DNA binding protein
MKDANAIVVLTAEQLKALLSELLDTALAKAGPKESDIMDTEACAAMIGVHPKTMAKLIRVDGLPTLRNIGNLRRFSRRAVLEWMARRKSA